MKIINVLLLILFISPIVNASKGSKGPEIDRQKTEVKSVIDRERDPKRPEEMSPRGASSAGRLAGMADSAQHSALKFLYKIDSEGTLHVLGFLKAEKEGKFAAEHTEVAQAIRNLLGSITQLGGETGNKELLRFLQILPDLGPEGLKAAKELMGELQRNGLAGESTLIMLRKLMPKRYLDEANGDKVAAFKKFLEDFWKCLEFFKA